MVVTTSALCCLLAGLLCYTLIRTRGLRDQLAGNHEQARKQARTDALTQLPNRLALQERLPEMLERARANEESVAVLFVDVDRFKTINDTLGHRIGDMLLRTVSARLTSTLPLGVTVFRPGGDEFIVVADRVRHKRTIAAAAMQVLEAFHEPFKIEGRELFVTASVGASVFPKNADTADELVAFADSAMYRAKETGKNNAKFYDGTMHAHSVERMALEQDLRMALARNEMRLVFQPVVELATGRIVAAETLVRWNHPALGLLSPQAFISIAEETGIIVEMSRWLLHEACKRAAEMRRLSPDFRIAVNLSPRDFYERELPEAIRSALAKANLPPEALDIEVTESIVISDEAVETLARVKALGVRIVMDDFGIGYSSLAYIKRLPIDALKIDKTFLKDVTRDAHDQGIIRAISALAKTLGLRLIAEGVESEAQRKFLRTIDCEYAQGHLFAHPGSWDAVVDAVEVDRLEERERRVIPLYGTK